MQHYAAIVPSGAQSRIISAMISYGVQIVWVVVPEERQVYVYESSTRVRILAADDMLTGADFLPGFRLPVVSLFQRSLTSSPP
jgi:hypothetical protein